jgi:hypothetical protein
MAFYPLPFGHVELRIDRRDPHPPVLAAESVTRRRRRRWRLGR